MLRIIRELRPKYIVGENVGGIVSWDGGLVFEQVQAEMEAEGYEVQAFVLPACAVNAPHRRDRVWFVAHRTDTGVESLQRPRENGIHGLESTANARSSKPQGRDEAQDGQQHGGGRNLRRKFAPFGSGRIVADTENQDGRLRVGKGKENTELGSDDGHGIAANATSERRKKRKHSGVRTNQAQDGARLHDRPKRFGGNGCFGRLTDWTRFPTVEPSVHSGNDGFPAGLAGITVSRHRRESIKAYGNAIVPQVAVQIFKAIIEAEKAMNP